MKLKVSDRHILLRAILTAVFFVIAVVAFTVGITNIGRKTSGYQLIEGKADAEAMTYNNAVHYKYWFEGSSNQIKRSIRGLEAEYTPVLSAAYKQLDHQNTYMGQVSIGTLNQSLGREVKVSAELYAVLKDAYSRTLEKKGFNMFAGDLYEAWHSILILADAQEFDPSVNQTQAERIEAIAAMVNDLSNFSLEFVSETDHRIRFSVSDAYREFCERHEIESMALDLNILKDAYLLQWLGTKMVEKGYVYGYFFTEEGLVLNTSDRGSHGYEMYTLERDSKGSLAETVYATLNLDGVFSATTLTAFSMGSDYGYSLEIDGGTVFRNEHFDVSTGGFPGTVLSLTVIRPDLDLVSLVCRAVELFNLGSESAIEELSSELEAQGFIVSYIGQSVL